MYKIKSLLRFDTNVKKVFVLGQSKSGTSAICYLIYNALDGKKEMVFEPTTFGLKRGEEFTFHKKICRTGRHVVSKCLTFPQFSKGDWDSIREIASLYNHRIWIDRDPRDRLISDCFYKWYSGHRQVLSTEKKKDWDKWYQMTLDRVREKEQCPQKYAFIDICNKWWQENGLVYIQNREHRTYDSLSDNRHRFKNWTIIKYENYVDGKVDVLSQAIDMPLECGVEVPNTLNRVVRTKSYGNWRDWFTDKDVAFFKPIYSEYLKMAGYNHLDWKLNYPKALDSTFGSKYIERIHNANSSG